MSNSLSYCGQLVQEQDPDRFLLSMLPLSPKGYSAASAQQMREDLWALFAFNHEIAKTREVVSETQLGLIRLQWWRDRIAEVYSPSSEGYGATSAAVQGNEVLKALAKAVERHGLPQELFDTLIYAREFDLEDVLPGNVEGLVNYADFTATPLMKLAVKITGGDLASSGDCGATSMEVDPVQPVAVNYALAGVLRAVPFHAVQRRCYLPEDLLKKAGQRMDHLYEGKAVAALADVIREVSEQAVDGIKCENRFLKASNKLAWMYLKQLRGCRYDVFNARMDRPPAFKVLRLLF